MTVEEAFEAMIQKVNEEVRIPCTCFDPARCTTCLGTGLQDPNDRSPEFLALVFVAVLHASQDLEDNRQDHHRSKMLRDYALTWFEEGEG